MCRASRGRAYGGAAGRSGDRCRSRSDSRAIIVKRVVVAAGIVALPLLGLLLWGEPYQRGFFLDDESIRLPFKQQTISEGLLAGVGFAIIVATVLLTELVRDKRATGIGEKFLSGSLVPGWLWETYGTVGIYTFGAACQQLTVNMSKYVIGRLRPNFIDVCRPVFDTSNEMNALGYIQNFTCTGNDTQMILDGRLSFPSAHSSYSLYTALFFILYIQVKGKWRGSKLLRHGVQFAALMGAWYVGLSRLVEHKHHWSDVAVGFFIGSMYAVITFFYVLKPKKYGMPVTWQDPQLPTNPLPRPVLAR